ncbi:hypothetical protein L484_020328 [Morus notabilis]|uniref:Uncharacterized protein n=1 Tax=Morus notabilis TaxID=981085 RepID=W9RF31_9ROSA|nr:hypothetical protein L484_020328 [Morus notabilis]
MGNRVGKLIGKPNTLIFKLEIYKDPTRDDNLNGDKEYNYGGLNSGPPALIPWTKSIVVGVGAWEELRMYVWWPAAIEVSQKNDRGYPTRILPENLTFARIPEMPDLPEVPENPSND